MTHSLSSQGVSRRQLLKGSAALSMAIPFASMGFGYAPVSVLEHGVKPNTGKLVTNGIQAAINACAKKGGGVVLLPPGEYMSGTIELKSNVTLHLAAGSMLKSSPNREDFLPKGGLIFARGEKNVGVSGQGTIDGNYSAYVKWRGDRYRGGPTGMGDYDPEPRKNSNTSGRPRSIFFVECQNVRIQDVFLTNGATWTVHIMGCKNVWMEAVTIDNHLEVPNNDAVDIDHCQQVRISDCNISAGDDALCFKTTNPFTGLGPCEDIVVTNCNLRSRSSAIKLGSAGHEPIRNAVFSNCTISDSNRGVCIQNRDGGIWENITFTQMTIQTRHFAEHRWGASEPLSITNLQRKEVQNGLGMVRGVQFNELICHAEAGAFFFADPAGTIQDVVMSNVFLNIIKPVDRYGVRDLRPSYKFRRPSEIELAGVKATGVNGLSMRGVDVRFEENMPEGYGSALWARESKRIDHSGFKGKAAQDGFADIDIQ